MISISKEPLIVSELQKEMADPRAGAFVEFEGLVRNHNEGKEVRALEYECFESLALIEGEKIIQEAKQRFKVYDIHCVHRVGLMDIKDLAVWVGVTSAHRDAAFQACRFVIDELKVRLPIWKKEHYFGHSEWVNCQQCAHHHQKVQEVQADHFYSRQTNLREVGQGGQKKLSDAKVLVVGAGGLGCPALTYLTAAGVGTIGICDGDRVDMSNLHRQTLFQTADVGKDKAHKAKDHLQKLNPLVNITAHTEKIDAENAQRIILDYDYVLDCTDNFKAKFLIHDACFFTQVKLVQASIYQFEGQLQVFNWKKNKGCMRCIWPDLPEEGSVGNCADVGVIGVVPGVLGSLQASEVIKMILGLGEVSDDKTLFVDLLTNEITHVRRAQSDHCPLCGADPKIDVLLSPNYESKPLDWEVTVSPFSVKEKLGKYEWIDVRSEQEWLNSPWEKKLVNIPIQNIAQFKALDLSKKYLMACEKGQRSRKLVENLRDSGHSNFFSLKGGLSALDITEWPKES